jgi:hypothetical protein
MLFFQYQAIESYKKAAITSEALLDSVLVICQQIPDTVHTSDTIYTEKIVYQEVYKPVPASEGETKEYFDTTKTTDLDFWIHDLVRGEILSRKTGYLLKVPLIIRDTTRIYKEVPKLIEVIKIKKTENKGYISGSIGGSIGVGHYTLGFGSILNSRHALGLNIIYYKGEPGAAISYTYFIKK